MVRTQLNLSFRFGVLNRQLDDKRRALVWPIAFSVNGTAESFQRESTEVQPQTAAGLPSREMSIENSVDCFLIHSTSVVAKSQVDRGDGSDHVDSQLRLASFHSLHRIARVANNVDQYLEEQRTIATNGNVAVQLKQNLNVFPFQARPATTKRPHGPFH